ncbi:MAG: nuclease [Deltaproteobacteria bacterium]|nr:nuclease [Deltaproteobacteria bacterium]
MIVFSLKTATQLLANFILTLALTGSAYADSASWQGVVLAVLEGDTILVSRDGKKERIQLYGIDCPERGQDFGQVAKNYAEQRLAGRTIDVEPAGTSRRDRNVALVFLDEELFNLELVRVGLAWVRMQSCTMPDCKGWREVQKGAKRRRAGVWSDLNPVPPWEYKRSTASKKGVYSGNILTHVFHATSCEEFDCNNCIAVFHGRDAAIKAGYTPCDLCKP